MESELILFSGNANLPLAKRISQYLDIPLGKAQVTQFSDGETRVELMQNVRGTDAYLIQPMCSPANHNIMEAVIMIDALRRSSAKSIVLVCPYYGYSRQERKSAPRTPITAKLVADLYEAAGVSRLLTLDLHTSAIQGFFNIPVDHLFAKPVLVDSVRKSLGKGIENAVVVSPDAGGAERARAYAKHFGCGMAIIDKRRDRPNESAVAHIIGEVKGKSCVIVDDIVDTAGSLTKAAEALLEAGAESVTAAIVHPVLSGPAIERIKNSKLDSLLVTDSIPLTHAALSCEKIQQVSVSELLAKAIRRIHNQDSISKLFI
ncbi:MAG: ribose-phosphate pyrophosphokinase [Bdellovibrionota bacterium]